MRLSRVAEYALQATLRLAQPTSGRSVPFSLLASSDILPERLILQVLRDLTTHGIIVWVPGVPGSYMLGRPLSQISLLNLLEAVEGPVEGYFPPSNFLSDDTQLKLREMLERIAVLTRRGLNRLTLAQLIPLPSVLDHGKTL